MSAFSSWHDELTSRQQAAVAALRNLGAHLQMGAAPTADDAEGVARLAALRRGPGATGRPVEDAGVVAERVTQPLLTAIAVVRSDLGRLYDGMDATLARLAAGGCPALISPRDFDDGAAITTHRQDHREWLIAPVQSLPAGHPARALLPEDDMPALAGGKCLILAPFTRTPTGALMRTGRGYMAVPQWFDAAEVARLTREFAGAGRADREAETTSRRLQDEQAERLQRNREAAGDTLLHRVARLEQERR